MQTNTLGTGASNDSGFVSFADIDVTDAEKAQDVMCNWSSLKRYLQRVQEIGAFQKNNLESNLNYLRIAMRTYWVQSQWFVMPIWRKRWRISPVTKSWQIQRLQCYSRTHGPSRLASVQLKLSRSSRFESLEPSLERSYIWKISA